MALSAPQLNLAQSLTTVYPPPQGTDALVQKAFQSSLTSIPPAIKDYMQAIVAAAQGQIGLLEAVEARMKGHLEVLDFVALGKDGLALEALSERAETQVRKVSIALEYEETEERIKAARAEIDRLVDEANQALQTAKTGRKKSTRAPSQRKIEAREIKLREADVERNVALMALKRLKGLLLRIERSEQEEIIWNKGGVWEAAVGRMTTAAPAQNQKAWQALARRVSNLLTAYQVYKTDPTVFNKVCLRGLINQYGGAAGIKRKAEEEPAAQSSSSGPVKKRRRKKI